jgi:hypothetical protein
MLESCRVCPNVVETQNASIETLHVCIIIIVLSSFDPFRSEKYGKAGFSVRIAEPC